MVLVALMLKSHSQKDVYYGSVVCAIRRTTMLVQEGISIGCSGVIRIIANGNGEKWPTCSGGCNKYG